MATAVKQTSESFVYVPIMELEGILKQMPDLPYRTVFSLEPYINTLKNEMCTACDMTKSALMPVLEANNKFLAEKSEDLDDIMQHPNFQTLMSMVVPSMMFNDDLSYLAPPFEKNFIVRTKALIDFFDSKDWEVKIDTGHFKEKDAKLIVQAGIHILNKLYGQNIPRLNDDLFPIRNKRTKLIRYYSMNFKSDFIDVEYEGDLPELSQSDIDYLLKNPEDKDLWLRTLPPEKFIIKGFCVGNLFDVTEIQVLSDLKQWLSYAEDMRPEEYFEFLSYYIQSYLGVEDIQVGGLMLDKALDILDGNISLTGETNMLKLLSDKEGVNGIYDHVLNTKRIFFIEDLRDLKNPSKSEKKLLKKGIKSFVINPLVDESGNVIAFLELGSKQSGVFTSWNVKKLQEVFNQLKLSFEKFNADLNNRITSIIQNNFTSIHPSVSWKFEEVAKNYYIDKQSGSETLTISPIVFNNVYPLYAQSDIKSSSTIRNKLIKSDLEENIEILISMLKSWDKKLHIHLLDSYIYKLEETLSKLKTEFVSSDESAIVNLITKEIRPLLNKAIERYPELNDKYYKNYISKLDPHLGIIYKKRKDFENSVNRLNSEISKYLEKEEEKMQAILPHYFEKYKTDGVEYNLYLGESLLQNGSLNNSDLKNFKLWQLVTSCEITRLVDRISPELEVPLTTAELIFVYNHPLSIRFRMDEKKFDVDGAYNVRYEILKKRIDKATIKGTNERLTIKGKVAIVYLSDKDKQEYLEFFNYLKAKDLIEEEIEQLELNDLQGAEGLNALRVTVNTKQ